MVEWLKEGEIIPYKITYQVFWHDDSITLKNKFADSKKNEKFTFEELEDVDRFIEVTIAHFPKHFKRITIEDPL